jgi:hypothetical protein
LPSIIRQACPWMWGYALKDGEAPTNPSRSKKLRHVAQSPRFMTTWIDFE